MHGDVASELDRYWELLLFEQRGRVLFAKNKKGEKGGYFSFSFGTWKKRNALSTMETMPVRLL